MYHPQVMDARRVDELSTRVTGLRFFQQLPSHLVHKFLHSMTMHRLRAESLVFKQGDLGDSFAVIVKGTIAVYAKKTNKETITKEDEKHHIPTHEGDADLSAPPSPRTAALAGAQPKRGRQLRSAVQGSISIPVDTKLNPATGSISLPQGSSPLTSLPPPPVAPVEHTFSLVVNPNSKPMKEQSFSVGEGENRQRGISLVPGWVTPPSSDDDSDSDSDSSSDKCVDEGDEAQGDMTKEERAAAAAATAAAAVEQARLDARARLELEEAKKEERELEELMREEQELQRLEAQEAKAEMECLTTLHACDSFGLLTILESAKRSATLIALDDTELAVLSRTKYEELMRELNREPVHQHHSVAGKDGKAPAAVTVHEGKPRCHIPSLAKYLRLLKMPSEQREDSQLNYLITPLLKHNRLLQMLDQRSLQLVASAMKILHVPKSGVILQKQGEEAEWLYVVIKGSVSEHVKMHPSGSSGTSTHFGSHAGAQHVKFQTSHAPANSYDPGAPQRPGTAQKRTLSPSTSRRNLSPSKSSDMLHVPQSSQFSISSPRSPNPSSGGSGDLLSLYGPCTRLLLTGDLSPLSQEQIAQPSFWARAPCTLITREPVILAKLNMDYIAHILMNCQKPMRGVDTIREAALSKHTPEKPRSDTQLEVLDSVLKHVGFFQFKPPALRKNLCARMTLTTYTKANSIVFHEGQESECFYIILSGSVSIHQNPDGSGPVVLPASLTAGLPVPSTPIGGSAGNNALAAPPAQHIVLPSHASGFSILQHFGPCLSIGRPAAHFGDQALISTLPRNMTILTRTPVELLCITRKSYDAVFVPVLDEMQYHASKALQLLSRPQRTPAVVNALVDVLKHVSYFADMSVTLRSFAIKHMEVETCEGDSVIFLEDDDPDYMYIVMSGSVGVHIHDKKQKELLRQAKLEQEAQAALAAAESGEASSATDNEAARRAKEASMASKLAELDSALSEDARKEVKTEDELLAEQMQRDAEAEVQRLLDEKNQNKKKGRKKKHSSDSDDDEEDQSDSDSDDDSSTSSDEGSNDRKKALPTAAAARLQASARGDVFTASGAGQYALARKLRNNSVSSGTPSATGVDALAGGLKKAEAEEFKRKMALAASGGNGHGSNGAASSGSRGRSSPDASSSNGTGEDGSLERQLSQVLSEGAATGRTQIGHLTAAERTEQYGPCVVQLPSGSVVGEVALTNAGQRNKRTATIITMEPTFFIKLHGDVVSRLTFGRAAASGGTMSQDAMANFLKTLDILRIVKGSATGAGTGSHATFKRLAYHMKDRTLASGVKVIEQGQRAENVFFIVSGQIIMSRTVLVNGMRRKNIRAKLPPGVKRERFQTYPQVLGESFQRVDTSYLPEPTGPEYIPPPPVAPPPIQTTASGGSSEGNGTTGGAAAPTVPSGLAPIPEGLQLKIELTAVGAGELVGGLDAFAGAVHNSCFTVTSAECVVLQMKRSHFISMFPSRALELVKAVGEQRALLYDERVKKFLTLRCKGLNDNPYAAGLANMVGSGMNLQSTPHEDAHDEDEPDTDHAAAPVTLPSATPALTGSVSMKQLRPASAVDKTITASASAAHLTSPKMHARKAPLVAIKDVQAVADEVISLDDPTSPQAHAATMLSPKSAAAAAHAASQSQTAAHAQTPGSPPMTKRQHVLAPPVNKTPVLQSTTLMHHLKLKAISTTPPLTPVQKALGYSAEPVPPTFSWTEQEAASGRADLDRFTLNQSQSATSSPVGKQRPQTGVVRGPSGMRGSASELTLPRPNTTQTARSPASDSLPPAHPVLGHSQSSVALAAELSASSQLEQDALAAEQAARRKAIKRGSIRVDPASSHALGGGVEYTLLQPVVVPTKQEITIFSDTLSKPPTGGIIGIHELSDRPREAREDEQILTSSAVINNLNLSRRGSRVVTPRREPSPVSTLLSQSVSDTSQPSLLHPPPSPHAPLLQSELAVARVSVTVQPDVDDAPVAPVEVSQLDVEARAIVLMRAEKAQMLWETSEINRRGHRLMEKVRPTSYNMAEEEKQAMLSRSLAWDKVSRTDPSSQSNAFIHSASPPLAVMHNIGLISPSASTKDLRHARTGSNIASSASGTVAVSLGGFPNDDPTFDFGNLASPSSGANDSQTFTIGASTMRASTPQRAYSANLAARNAARLNTAASPIIRSLLTPLVDSSFTSLFQTQGQDFTPFFSTSSLSPGRKPLTNRAGGTSGVKSGSGTPGRKVGIGSPLGRPSTAGDARPAEQVAFSASARPHTSSTTSRAAARHPTQTSNSGSLTGFGLGPSHSSSNLSGQNAAASSDATKLATHRVSSAGLKRAASSSALPTAKTTARPTTAFASRMKNKTSARDAHESKEAMLEFDSTSLAPWAQEDGADSSTTSVGELRGSNHMPASLAVQIETPIGSNQGTPSCSPSALPRSPIRHTRTASLGSFMRLASAGVERQPSTLSPNALVSWANDWSPSRGAFSGGGDWSSSMPQDPISEDEDDVGDDVKAAVKLLSSPKGPTSLSSFSPANYAAAHRSAFTKQSFIDERAAASLAGAQVVQDSHQSIYSRARAMGPLPGTKANPSSGSESLSKDEFEALRRKRLYGIATPKVTPDNPSAFAKVLSLSESLPGKLLASKSANSSKKARLDELAVAAAAKDGLASKILQEFKNVNERI